MQDTETEAKLHWKKKRNKKLKHDEKYEWKLQPHSPAATSFLFTAPVYVTLSAAPKMNLPPDQVYRHSINKTKWLTKHLRDCRHHYLPMDTHNRTFLSMKCWTNKEPGEKWFVDTTASAITLWDFCS